MIYNASCKQYRTMAFNAMKECIVLLWTRIWSVCMQTQEHQTGCFCPASPSSKSGCFLPIPRVTHDVFTAFLLSAGSGTLKIIAVLIMFSHWPWIAKVAQREAYVIEETWEMSGELGPAEGVCHLVWGQDQVRGAAPGHQPAKITFE